MHFSNHCISPSHYQQYVVANSRGVQTIICLRIVLKFQLNHRCSKTLLCFTSCAMKILFTYRTMCLLATGADQGESRSDFRQELVRQHPAAVAGSKIYQTASLVLWCWFVSLSLNGYACGNHRQCNCLILVFNFNQMMRKRLITVNVSIRVFFSFSTLMRKW
jgi:hypothetical protein